MTWQTVVLVLGLVWAVVAFVAVISFSPDIDIDDDERVGPYS